MVNYEFDKNYGFKMKIWKTKENKMGTWPPCVHKGELYLEKEERSKKEGGMRFWGEKGREKKEEEKEREEKGGGEQPNPSHGF